MNLQIIAGPSGAGKSTYIYNRIVEQAIANPDKHYLILVPLQYSMQTQRILVFAHPRRSIMNIDVLSFERLAYRVFDELGTNKTHCLDETGKVLLLRRAASLISDDLGILKRNIGRRGYIDQVKSLISELMQYGYSPDDLDRMASSPTATKAFREKAEDIEKLYREFLKLFDQSMFTEEQVLSLLCEVCDRSELLKDSVIVLDGYTGFTPVQKELLGRLSSVVDTVYACICADPDTDLYSNGSEDELFYMSREESCFLSSLAGDGFMDPVIIGRGHGRFSGHDDMAFVEEHIFRDDGARLLVRAENAPVSLYSLGNVNQELLYTAQRIHQLIRTEEGLHYRDIAVVCPDVSVYRYSIERIFASSGIPVFVDERKSALFNPLTEFCDSAFDLIRRRMSYDSLMRFLRTGLTPLSAEETDILDNYLYEASFRNTTYLWNSFTRRSDSFRKDSDLIVAEQIREKIAGPLQQFYETQKRGITVRERMTSLFSLLVSFDVERKLIKRSEMKEEEGDMVAADLYRRMYGFLCTLADQMVYILGEERMKAADFKDMLIDGLDSIKPATVPKSNDSVSFGDLERSRLSDVRILFLIGAGDDKIPMTGDSTGIFSQEDRRILKEEGFELSPTDEKRSLEQKFYLYLVLTKARERIFISYHRMAEDGSAINGSYLFDEIRRLIPSAEICAVASTDPVFLETEKSADIVMTRGIREIIDSQADRETVELTSSLLAVKSITGRQDQRERFLGAAFFENKKTPLSEAVTEALYGKDMQMSVSRLETFARCAYSYFLQYGLSLSERRRNEFKALDLGNLYHGALERFGKSMISDGLTWEKIDQALVGERLRQGFEAELSGFKDRETFIDPRENHFKDSAYRNLLFNTMVMTEQIKAGSFVPVHFEQELKDLCDPSDLMISLPGGRSLSFTGRIDRIDIARLREGDYVKIVDYKTGTNRLDPILIGAGLELQLLVYLRAALSGLRKHSGRNTLPGAVFYYQIMDPRVDEASPLTDDMLHQKLLNELRPSGFVADDMAVISALDNDLTCQTSYKSPFVNLSTRKDGSLGTSEMLLPMESFSALSMYTRDMAASLGSHIAGGDTYVNPYRYKGRSACDRCPYSGVCHFDTRLRGFYYRDLDNSLASYISPDQKGKKGSTLKGLITKVMEKEEGR